MVIIRHFRKYLGELALTNFLQTIVENYYESIICQLHQ